MSTEPIRYDHLASSNPELYRALGELDQAAERAGQLAATPGVLSEADLESANQMVPGLRQLLGTAVGNASAVNLGRALETARGAGRVPASGVSARSASRNGVSHRRILEQFRVGSRPEVAERLLNADADDSAHLESDELAGVGSAPAHAAAG